MLTCSPVAKITSNSRFVGAIGHLLGQTDQTGPSPQPWPRPRTTTSWPPARAWATRRATFLIRSTVPDGRPAELLDDQRHRHTSLWSRLPLRSRPAGLLPDLPFRSRQQPSDVLSMAHDNQHQECAAQRQHRRLPSASQTSSGIVAVATQRAETSTALSPRPADPR